VAGPHGRASHFDFRGDPRVGAAEAAPTAPHATTPPKRDTSGPARFWNASRAGVLAVLLVAAVALHLPLTPWNIDFGIDIKAKDVDGELSIPIDLEADDEPAKDEQPEPAPQTTPGSDKPGPNARDGGAKPAPPDGGADAESTQAGDAAVPLAADGAAPLPDDGGAGDAGALDAGPVAFVDGGPIPGGGPRDFGTDTRVNTGPQNVTLVVNVAAIRSHALAPRIGAVLTVIPQWRSFLQASTTPLNPVQDAEWIFIYGPSLKDTDRDAVLVRYNTSDAVIDTVVDAIAKRANDKHEPGGPFGPYDAGVPGVKATSGHADNAPRVFLRPQPKLLVIAPPKHAHDAALAYSKRMPAPQRANEALHLTVKNPSQQVAIPGLKFSAHLKTLRLWIMPDAAGGADLYADGDCDDESAAPPIAQELTDLLKDLNGKGIAVGPFKVTVSTTTKHLLDNAVVTAEGKRINLHIKASPEQLDAVLRAVESSPLAQP
jgi:hypothetical protein